MYSYTGIAAATGVAHGTVRRFAARVQHPPNDAVSPDAEQAATALKSAMNQVAGDLLDRAGRATGQGQEILEATAMIAQDPTLYTQAQGLLDRVGVQQAVWEAAEQIAAQFAALGGRMAERVTDIRDVRDRVIAALAGRPAPGIPESDTPFILVADDLAPADTATLDPAKVLGIVTREGGLSSHTAILARDLGLPTVVGLADADLLTDGLDVMVDGGKGIVTVDPDAATVATATNRAARLATLSFDGNGRTADGFPVQLLANAASPESATAAAQAGAQGIGLFRTEFCFLDRTTAPSIEEQATQYAGVMAPFAGKKVVVRTLDAGADKPLPFLNPIPEPNPALGVRGWRLASRAAEILEDQLAAIRQAADTSGADVWVMAPMVSTLEDATEFAAAAEQHGLPIAGVMVEVPAAALLADAILGVADFASLGTNDLAQYTMAADRMVAETAAYTDPWQPAVLKLIAATAAAGQKLGKPVGVCGESASIPAMAVVLTGLGITSLSMSHRALPAVAAVLAATPLARCQELAQLAITSTRASQAKEVVTKGLPILEELGL